MSYCDEANSINHVYHFSIWTGKEKRYFDGVFPEAAGVKRTHSAPDWDVSESDQCDHDEPQLKKPNHKYY